MLIATAELAIDRPDKVWSADIAYIRMAQGFLYLIAIMDWYSRYVLSWRLSNTLDVGFCLEALETATAIREHSLQANNGLAGWRAVA